MSAAPPAPQSTPAAAAAGWLDFGLTTIVYVAAGLAALLIAIPPGYASPLYPASGIALASVLVFGWRMLFAVALGAFLVNASLITAREHQDLGLLGVLAVPALVGAAAALQAAIGAALVRFFVRQPLTLTMPRDVAAFLGCCAASSVVASTVATAALLFTGTVPAGGLAFAWGTWWIGDLAGLLLVTPIALTLIGRPRSEWAPRRVSVGLTLTLVTTFLVLGIVQVGRWNSERLRLAFEHDASSASLVLTTRLQEPLRALEALRGVFSVHKQVDRAQMRVATANWLDSGAVRALGWSERVRRDDLAAFEARAQADGAAGYRVFDRSDAAPLTGAAPAAGAPPPMDDRGEVMALRLIEPLQGNAAALGINALSEPTARAAIAEAIATGRATATPGFQLGPPAVADPLVGVVVYQAIYDQDGDAITRRRAARGVVFASLGLDAQLAGVRSGVPAYLDLCLVDAGKPATRQRLAGPPGCEGVRTGFIHEQPIVFAGQEWSLRVLARPEDVPSSAERGAWFFSAAGLLSAALLGASLLITTGRTRRIESAVRERTAALRAEVGERHAAEAALRESEQRFRNILDHVPIGVVYTDLTGQVIQANPRYCELTGYAESELTTLTPSAITHADDVDEAAALTAQLIAGRIPAYRRNERYVTKAGGVVWVQSTVSLLRDSQNLPWRIVAVVEDITEHLRLEEAEHAREAAEASNQAKSEFLSRMSHELRTPLNAMLGFAQLLDIDQRHPLAPLQRPWVAQIQQAGWHLLEMINDVLDLSRIESGNLRLQPTTLDLAEIVAASVTLVASDAERRRITITVKLAEGTAGVLGDVTRVKQILTNLLSNAVKYNHDGGHVHVTSRPASADQVELSVADTGMGMTPTQMEELFKPFNRLGRERSSLQGTGIGLVISRRLAELMGGSIRVRSLPGQGSSFLLRLPKAIDPDTVPSELDDDESIVADYHRRIVHYVEDNETNVEVMRGIVAQRPQVQLETSIAGLDGLAAVRTRRPHLILLDMHLPDISGLELLRHLKADPATASIPVVVVSADATAQQIDAALDAGAARYLTKPVQVTELLAALDDLLERMDTAFS